MFSTLLISNSQGQWYLQVIPGPCICSLWRLETNGNSFLRLGRFSTNTARKSKETIRNKLKGRGGGIRVNGLDRQVRIKFLVIAKDHF